MLGRLEVFGRLNFTRGSEREVCGHTLFSDLRKPSVCICTQLGSFGEVDPPIVLDFSESVQKVAACMTESSYLHLT